MSDKIDIKGKVDKILDVQEFASGFKKQVIVIEVDGKFPQKVAVEFGKDKIDLLSSVAVGNEVSASVNIRGSEYNGRYFVSLAGWKIDILSAGTAEEDDQSIPF
jgi:hypothetical protein